MNDEMTGCNETTENGNCPYFDERVRRCSAVVGDLRISWQRSRVQCAGGDFDACSRFLVRVLQNSQSRSCREIWSLNLK